MNGPNFTGPFLIRSQLEYRHLNHGRGKRHLHRAQALDNTYSYFNDRIRQADLNFTMIGTKVFITHALSPVNEIFRVRPLKQVLDPLSQVPRRTGMSYLHWP